MPPMAAAPLVGAVVSFVRPNMKPRFLALLPMPTVPDTLPAVPTFLSYRPRLMVVLLFACCADSRTKLPVVDVAGQLTSSRAVPVPITSSDAVLVDMVVKVIVADVAPVAEAAASRIMQVAPGQVPDRLVSTPR